MPSRHLARAPLYPVQPLPVWRRPAWRDGSEHRQASQLTASPGEGPPESHKAMPGAWARPEPRRPGVLASSVTEDWAILGPWGMLCPTPALFAGDSAGCAGLGSAQTGPWSPGGRCSPPPHLWALQTVRIHKAGLDVQILDFPAENKNRVLKCGLRPHGSGAGMAAISLSAPRFLTRDHSHTQGCPKAQRSSGVWGQRWPGLC